MKKHGLILALAAVVFALNGCGSGSSSNDTTGTTGSTASNSSGGKTYTIAVIPKGSTHDYWKSIHEGANNAAARLGNVTIDWKGPEKEDDREGQISVVEDFVTQKVDGIVLAPLDENALAAPVKEATDANIPVVIIDSALNGVTPVSAVMTDNEKAGEKGGDELAKELGGKGSVIMMRYEEGSASTEDREKGFLAAIAKNPGIKVISDNQYAGATVDSAQKTAENLIETYNTGGKFQADGIFCPNESSALGMLRALQSANLAGKVKFVGFDSSAPLVDGVKSGQINAIVVQNPVKMADDAVTFLVEHIEGKTVPTTEDTGATVVSKDNMNDPTVAALIAPPKA